MCGIFFTFSKNKENIKKYSHSKKKLIECSNISISFWVETGIADNLSVWETKS